MKTVMLMVLATFMCGCISRIEKPYYKETLLDAIGKPYMIKEFSAERSDGISVGDLKQIKP